MALTEAQNKALIILQVGDIDPTTGNYTRLSDGIVASNIDLLWEAYAELSPRLRILYAKQAAIELVLARLADKVDFTSKDLSVKANQQVQNYESKFELVKAEIIKANIARSGTPATGLLKTVEPDEPDLLPKGPSSWRRL